MAWRRWCSSSLVRFLQSAKPFKLQVPSPCSSLAGHTFLGHTCCQRHTLLHMCLHALKCAAESPFEPT
jgi:hypothetical protein